MPKSDEKFNEEVRKLADKPFPDQAKKIIYLFRNRAAVDGKKRPITKQQQLGTELNLDATRMNKAYWGVESLQPHHIENLAKIYKFDPELFALPPDEFILNLGGWTIRWSEAIELAEAVKAPIQIVGIKNEIKKEKQMRLSQYPDKYPDETQTIQANTSFQWKLNCSGLVANGINEADINTYQTFAFEYDLRTEMVQSATVQPENKISDARKFFKHENNNLWWVFPEPTAKIFPLFPQDDVEKTIGIILFVFKQALIDDELNNGILTTKPLKFSDPMIRRFSSTFYGAAKKSEKLAVAIRSRVRVVLN
jgi:hypothetical protein